MPVNSQPYLFDTGALIDIYRGRQRVRPYFDALAHQSAYVSVISEAELWMGLRPGEISRHEALLNYFIPLPINSAVARMAGGWMQRYRPQGLGWMDALITASAKYAGAAVLTRDLHLASVLAEDAEFVVYAE